MVDPKATKDHQGHRKENHGSPTQQPAQSSLAQSSLLPSTQDTKNTTEDVCNDITQLSPHTVSPSLNLTRLGRSTTSSTRTPKSILPRLPFGQRSKSFHSTPPSENGSIIKIGRDSSSRSSIAATRKATVLARTHRSTSSLSSLPIAPTAAINPHPHRMMRTASENTHISLPLSISNRLISNHRKRSTTLPALPPLVFHQRKHSYARSTLSRTNSIATTSDNHIQNMEPRTSHSASPHAFRSPSSTSFALLRRTSSFGGAPVVVVTPSANTSPLTAMAPETDIQDSQLPFSLNGKINEGQDLLLSRTGSEGDKSSWRWVVLLLSCTLLFGNYYAYDNPAALNTYLHEHLNISYDNWQVILNMFYSVYSLPNTVLPLLGGSLLDSYDPRIVLLSFCGCVFFGQVLFAFGVQTCYVPLMIIGRVLFGIGGESVGVVQSWIVAGWFQNHELAFALGLTLCVARLGSVFNSILSPRIASSAGVSAAVWMGTVTCLFSFGCAFSLCAVMSKFGLGSTSATDETNSINNSKDISSTINRSPLVLGVDEKEKEHEDNVDKDVEEEEEEEEDDDEEEEDDGAYWFRGSRQLRQDPLDMDVTNGETEKEQVVASDVAFDEEAAVNERTPLIASSVKNSPKAIDSWYHTLKIFPKSFWLVCAICILLYGTVVPFNNVVSDFLQDKWYHGNAEKAGLIMSIPDTLSAILVPPLGYVVDKYGRRATLLILCSFTICSVHLILGLTNLSPILPFIALGMSYSIYGVAIWPSIACIVNDAEARASTTSSSSSPSLLSNTRSSNDELLDVEPNQYVQAENEFSQTVDSATELKQPTTGKFLGTAYGLSTSALNTALTFFPLLAASVRVGSDWEGLELFFAAMAGVGGLLSIQLLWTDISGSGVLEKGEVKVNEIRIAQPVDYIPVEEMAEDEEIGPINERAFDALSNGLHKKLTEERDDFDRV